MISTLASIHPDAKIGKNVQIEPFTTIYADVEIGDDTWVGPNVTIMDGARIGKSCKIFPGAVISAVPQDLKFSGEATTTEIGDFTTIRECVTINRGTIDRMTTSVGNNTLIMAYTHIAHDCIVGNNCVIANAVNMGGHVVIEDYVVIGGMSAIHQFVHIGMHAMVSGGSLVRKDVPPFVKAGREPLSYAGINSTGLKRRGFTSEQINQIQDVYRLLYLSKLNTSKALQKIDAEIEGTEERNSIVGFIQKANRGIMRGYTSED